MDYEEAKKLATQPPKDNYLRIKLSYDMEIVLPYKDGLAFLASLTKAEQLRNNYQEITRIVPLDQYHFTTMIMSADDYRRHKMAALLHIPPDKIAEMENQPPPKPDTQPEP